MTRQPYNHNTKQSADEKEMSGFIPDKRYFKIGEVCEIAGLKQHVLRYWELEFKKIIRPQRASSKQRLYRRVDVENILKIKKLLKDDGFTIPGAKKLLARKNEEGRVVKEATPHADEKTFMDGIKSELFKIQKILESD